jgi:segregation and condensation protein B
LAVGLLQGVKVNSSLSSQIEAILFVAGEGLGVEFLAEKLGAKENEVLDAVEVLKQKYSGDSGVHLIKYRKNFQFATNPDYAGTVSAVLNHVREKNLSRAALETIAIIAYKQPITRLKIDEVRGVASDYAVHILLQNNLIEVVGRKDSLGKPLLYGTTDEFLKRFELDDINNLPSYEQLLEKIKVIQTNFDLYESGRQA